MLQYFFFPPSFEMLQEEMCNNCVKVGNARLCFIGIIIITLTLT